MDKTTKLDNEYRWAWVKREAQARAAQRRAEAERTVGVDEYIERGLGFGDELSDDN